MLPAFHHAAREVTQGLEVTESDRGPALQMVTWLLLSLTALMLGFRVVSRFFVKADQSIGWEDVLIASSFVFGLGESIALVIPQGRIFGKNRHDLTPDEFEAGLKAGYAKDLLFFSALGFSKLSVCVGLLQLSPSRNHRTVTRVLTAMIATLTLVYLMASALRCGSKEPWGNDTSQCIDQNAFLMFAGVSSIITDAALVVIPVIIVSPLHMAFNLRLKVICFYSARILAIVSTVLQLFYLHLLSDENFTLQAFPYYIATQFVLLTSISSACVVYFWPLLRSLQSGMMTNQNDATITAYVLSMLSKPKSSKFDVSSAATDNQQRNRQEYIEITTELESHESENRSQPPLAKVYNYGWENQRGQAAAHNK